MTEDLIDFIAKGLRSKFTVRNLKKLIKEQLAHTTVYDGDNVTIMLPVEFRFSEDSYVRFKK